MNLDAYVGRGVETEDPYNSFQCMDWAFKVCDLLGIPRAAIRNLYARNVWTNRDPKYFDVVQGDPQYLDFAVWSSLVGPAGHIAVVKSGTTNNFTSYDQNWNSKPYVQLVNHKGAYGLYGFLRPKGVNMATDALTKEEVQEIHQIAFQGEYPPQTVVDAWTGKGVGEFVRWLHNGGAWQDRLKEIQSAEQVAAGDAGKKLTQIKQIVEAQ